MSGLAFPVSLRELTYREAEASYQIEGHSHQCYQFYAVMQGDVAMCIDVCDIQLGPNQCLLIPPHVQRAPRCTGRPPRYLHALFDVDDFEMQSLCTGALTGGARLPLSLNAAMTAQLDLLIADLQQPDLGNALAYRHAIFCQLLIDLRKHLRAGHKTQQLPALNAAARSEVLIQAEAFMRANLHLSLQREQIAQAVHFSAPHLARLFKAGIDKTITQRLTELRLDHAKHLLLHSTCSITIIAGEIGFQSFSHFAKIFHHAVGMTPSDYRRRGGRRLGSGALPSG